MAGKTSAEPPPVVAVPPTFSRSTQSSELPLLPGRIPGVTTVAIQVPAGARRRFAPLIRERRLLLVLSGRGAVQAGGARVQAFDDLALVIQPPTQGLQLAAAPHSPVTLLEMRWAQSPQELAGAAGAGLRVIRYADCPTYKEAIKSPKTVNRTLVPADDGPNAVPRFAMGSVETTGPDAVAEHAHPMLEQLFFGLPGNDCTVTADGAVTEFRANELLYIPLGSLHGAQVAPGRKLHYAWIDFFPTAADMQWIRDMHHDEPPQKAP